MNIITNLLDLEDSNIFISDNRIDGQKSILLLKPLLHLIIAHAIITKMPSGDITQKPYGQIESLNRKVKDLSGLDVVSEISNISEIGFYMLQGTILF